MISTPRAELGRCLRWENLDEPTTGTSSSISVDVPPGRGGIQPGITLLYNSSGGNGVLGMGWVMELGSIQRSTRKGVPQYDGNDEYVLMLGGSQEELIEISVPNEYRPKTEGGFSRIRKVGRYWEVTDKRGVRYYFGLRTEANSVVTDPNNSVRVFKWCLDRVEDIYGNSMTINYVSADNQVYPSVIEYGEHTSGVGMHGQVKINYESKTENSDFGLSYLSGFKISVTRRVKSIEVSGGGNLIRRYEMKYGMESESKRSLLVGVDLVGEDGVSKLPGTVLTYSGGETKLKAGATLGNAPTGYNLGTSKVIRLMDMNGDGKTDIVTGVSGLYNIYYNEITDGALRMSDQTPAVNPPARGFDDVNIRVADFNGDGLLDVIYGASGPYTLWLNNGVNGFNPGVSVGNSPGVALSENLVAFVDMNADGKTDILESYSGASGEYKIYLNTDGSHFSGWTWAPNSPERRLNAAGVQMGDFNGDGLSDVIAGDLPNYKIWLNNGVNGFRAGTTVVRNPAVALTDSSVQLVDMNGDGLTDILHGGDGSYTIYYNTGTMENNFEAGVSAVNSPELGMSNANVKFMDMNDDRQVDVVIGNPPGPYEVWLNNGTNGFMGGGIALGSYPDVNLDNENVVIADMNADGRMDILYGKYADWRVWINTHDSRCSRAGTLIDVDNSVGGHLELGYQHLGIKGLGGSVYRMAISPYVFNSVKTITRRASLTGQSYVTSYELKDGLWDNQEREFRGFKTVKVIDADGNTATTEYAQDAIYKGRPLTQSVYDSQNKLFGKSVNTWDNQEVYPGVRFVYLKQTDSTVYDGDATGKRTQQQYFYGETPQMGNLTKTISFGEVNLSTGADMGTDSVTVEVAYGNNTASGNWLVGLPRHTLTKDHAQAVIGQSSLYYDCSEVNTALPTKGR